MKGAFELPYLYEMKFRMYNCFVECSLDGVGVTITSEEVVCEKVEKYEDNNEDQIMKTPKMYFCQKFQRYESKYVY